MIIEMNKYCIMSEDKKTIEVMRSGFGKFTEFVSVEDAIKKQKFIKLRKSFAIAKNGFHSSRPVYIWNEDEKKFVHRAEPDKNPKYIIVELNVAYCINV